MWSHAGSFIGQWKARISYRSWETGLGDTGSALAIKAFKGSKWLLLSLGSRVDIHMYNHVDVARFMKFEMEGKPT